jgi:hypothetical protein
VILSLEDVGKAERFYASGYATSEVLDAGYGPEFIQGLFHQLKRFIKEQFGFEPLEREVIIARHDDDMLTLRTKFSMSWSSAKAVGDRAVLKGGTADGKVYSLTDMQRKAQRVQVPKINTENHFNFHDEESPIRQEAFISVQEYALAGFDPEARAMVYELKETQ